MVAFESSVDFDVQMMKGFGNIMFAGEGLFVTNLTGPGRVWIQSMPYVNPHPCHTLSTEH